MLHDRIRADKAQSRARLKGDAHGDGASRRGRNTEDVLESTDELVEGDAVPPRIGQQERRMQLRAYDMWEALLDRASTPALADFNAATHADLATHGVMIDFSRSAKDPQVVFLGASLAAQCDVEPRDVLRLSDAPRGSLLWRIADHYMQLVDGPAPIGFEAEFVDNKRTTILYRGILLPFTGASRAIDHVFAVINWKEVADPVLAEELLLELGQVIDSPGAKRPQRRSEARTGRAPTGLSEAMRRDLRGLEPRTLDALPDGKEFALVLVRRSEDAAPVILGEVPHDDDLLEEAALGLLR